MELSRCYLMVIPHCYIYDDSVLFNSSLVTCEKLDSHIDKMVGHNYSQDIPDFHTDRAASDDVDFVTTLGIRGEISKFGASIGSCTISDDECNIFENQSVGL